MQAGREVLAGFRRSAPASRPALSPVSGSASNEHVPAAGLAPRLHNWQATRLMAVPAKGQLSTSRLKESASS